MSLYVNGELVPSELVAEERRRWMDVPGWETIETAEERESLLQQASEKSAVERVLLRQEMLKDPTPIDPAAIDREIERARANNGCRTEMTTNQREGIEANLRLQRAITRLGGPEPVLTTETVRQFFEANREKFRLPETVRAAHILKRIDSLRSEAQAHEEMAVALAELEAGAAFSAVADRRSDCKGNGGDLGYFVRGHMVEEFDRAVLDLPVGARTGIFRTQFGLHVAKLLDRKPERLAEFEDVAAAAEKTLKGILAEQAVKRAMEKLVAAALIERRLDTASASACA